MSETLRAGSKIFVSLSIKRLYLTVDEKLISSYPIAIGKPTTPTPPGTYSILEKTMNPGGILGSRWMTFLFAPHGKYGIHGTNNPASIGTAASNGCIRMHNHHVEELFRRVHLDTNLHIQREPWKGQGTSLPGGNIYIIKSGDTLWKIAQAHNITVDEILALNKIVNPNAIYPGQEIILP